MGTTINSGNLPVATVAEDIADTAIITTVTASDADGQTITYSLDAANNLAADLALFEIDATTGAIRLQDGKSLDYDLAQSHTITVTATAGGTPTVDSALASTDLVVVINVTDVDAEPVITNTGMTVSNVQGATVITDAMLSATDSDTDDADVVFTVSNIPTGGDLYFETTSSITDNVTKNGPNNDGVLKFTLAQVKAGVVFYDASNTVGTEEFTFTVSNKDSAETALSTAVLFNTSDPQTFTITVERFVTVPTAANDEGTTGQDTIDESAATERHIIQGGDDDDTITASTHGDVIIGGYGRDTITLGDGADVVVHRFLSDSGSFTNRDGGDTINNFEVGVDKLLLVDENATPLADWKAFIDATGDGGVGFVFR